MGREIKRVPVDFDWPLNEVWQGFVEPDRLQGEPCAECNGSGQTRAGWWLQRYCFRLTMLADDIADQERGRPMHPWLREDPYPYGHWDDHKFVIDRPSADIKDLIAGLGAEHNQDYHIYRAIAEAAGLPNFGTCTRCDGEGSTEKYPGQRAEAEAWEPEEPPEGDGWQLWETVSEGSPISPVFGTSEELSAWMQSDAYHWGTSRPLTKAQADRFVGVGWAPSMIGTSQGIAPGEQLGQAARTVRHGISRLPEVAALYGAD